MGGGTTAPPPYCEDCGFRTKYENNPNSLLGRLWRWHAGWCPGFKRYLSSLSLERRQELIKRYKLKKYKQHGIS